jgi:hypothetical protein
MERERMLEPRRVRAEDLWREDWNVDDGGDDAGGEQTAWEAAVDALWADDDADGQA